MPERLLGLSEQQRACLRLVAKGMTSKEIAIELGVSPLTVDDYIKKAVSRMQTRTRREAARLLAEEENALPQSLRPPPEPVVEPDPELPQQVQPGRSSPRTVLGLPPVGGGENDLTTGERISGIAKIAFFAALLLILTVAIVQGTIVLIR